MARATRTRATRVPSSGVRRRSGLVLAAVRPIVDRLAADLDVAVWDVEFRREAARETLRIAIDRPGGLDAETIARFSERLSRELDASEAVPGDARYLLEVTSPGAERRLRTPDQFRLCIGRPVRLTFKDGREPVEATLEAVTDDGVSVAAPHNRLDVAYGEISQARLNVPGAG